MNNNKHIIISFFAVIILGVPWLITYHPQSTRFIDNIFSYVNNNYAAVFLHNSITANQLHDKYAAVPIGNPKVHIMIVPGHEPDFGGTEYNGIKERELNVQLAQYLGDFFKGNNHYEVTTARDDKSWNPDLQKYFTEHWDDILAFLKQNKDETAVLRKNGTITKISGGVKHNTAPVNVALRLFGINKWVDDNKVDIAIHIHFNDNPRDNTSRPGDYSGFTIYVPEKQYSNSTTTRVIADAVMKRLSKYNAISNMPKESGGVTEDQDLIAIGTFNTLNVPSMLIEYGYIYEQRFADEKVRDVILKDLAFQTYLGIQDFFGGPNDVSIAYDTLMLPHNWMGEISKNNSDKNDVLALQTALILEGLYPGDQKTKNDCPVSGSFGPCTIDALEKFQNKYGIFGEKGVVGEHTKNILNSEYSVKIK